MKFIHYNDLYSIRPSVPIKMKFTILADPSLVICALYFIYLTHALVYKQEEEKNYVCSLYHHALAKNPCPGGDQI